MKDLAVEIVFPATFLNELLRFYPQQADRLYLREAFFDPKPQWGSDGDNACNVTMRFFNQSTRAGELYEKKFSEFRLLSELLHDPVPGTKEPDNEYVLVRPKSRILKVWADLNEFHMQVVKMGFEWKDGLQMHTIRITEKSDLEVRSEYLRRSMDRTLDIRTILSENSMKAPLSEDEAKLFTFTET